MEGTRLKGNGREGSSRNSRAAIQLKFSRRNLTAKTNPLVNQIVQVAERRKPEVLKSRSPLTATVELALCSSFQAIILDLKI